MFDGGLVVIAMTGLRLVERVDRIKQAVDGLAFFDYAERALQLEQLLVPFTATYLSV